MSLVPITAGLAEIQPLADHAQEFLAASRAPATLRAYASDWADFVTWCSARQIPTLPAQPEAVVLYLTARSAELRVSTLERRLSAISYMHHQHFTQLRARGLPHPAECPTGAWVVREAMKGIRRKLGTAPAEKAALVTEDLKELLATLPGTLLGIRDRALLLLGFAGAFRRSELVGLDVDDLQFGRAGLAVRLKRSKTDQEGRGNRKGILPGSRPETCPVRSLQAWLSAAGIRSGPVFRRVDQRGRVGPRRLSDRAVALIVQRTAAAAGKDPTLFGGHSLRAGLATAAAEAEVEERDIMAQTLHTSERMVRKYIRHAQLFRPSNASGRVGL